MGLRVAPRGCRYGVIVGDAPTVRVRPVSGRPREVGDVRTIQRAAAGTAAVSALGLTLAVGLSAGASASQAVLTDFTTSRILVGQPPNMGPSALAKVAPDRPTTMTIQVEPIDDLAAPGGRIDITIDLVAPVTGLIDVVGLSPQCQLSASQVICAVPLDAGAPVPVAVPAQAIQLQARPSAPIGSAGTIDVSWALNNNLAPTMASIDVQIISAVTPTTPPPTTTPPPPATTTTTHPATTPAVIRPAPMKTTMDPSPSPSPTPEVTMTPDPTPEQNPGGGDPLAGGPPAPIPFATPPTEGPVWRSPALVLSLGTAAVGLLIALAYAAISLRRAGRD